MTRPEVPAYARHTDDHDEDPLAPARGCMTGVAVGFVLIAAALLAIRLLADGAAALAGLAALAVTG